ncbi:MAG: hypothetical protein M1834_007215 [Cirrosporium novae-zelandiae]|nr:MAG: hypothetical protein M1834_007215 [Cirrosporium novae-zelandiae]
MDLSTFDNLFQQAELLLQQSSILWAAIGTIIAALYLFSKKSEEEYAKIPTVKFISPLLPDFFSRLLFNSKASEVIYRGYKQYKDKAYRILKADGDLIVLSTKYCEELRTLPALKLNALEATFSDHVGDYTTILVGSHLHTQTIQRRLTPAIGQIIPRMLDELCYAFDVEFPKCEDKWVGINPYNVILRLVARAGARVFLGENVCRDEEWLSISISFTTNIFETVALLRPVPGFLQPIIGPLLPSSRRLSKQLKYAQDKLLVPIINKRRAAEQAGDPSYEKPDDFLQWMMDLADNPNDADPANLAHRLLGIMSMAVVHTSAMMSVHVIYDLITMPEWIEPLRKEIKDAVPPKWKDVVQASLLELKHLDSFMKESQRVNPPGHLSFHRIVKEDMTLSDGLKLSKGTHICMASGPISTDPEIVQDPEVFDGFRWSKENKGTSSFVSTGPTGMHFGLGRYACPGRFFASYVIKAILARILLDYDFKFGPGQEGRPKNIVIGDKIVPNYTTEVFFRKRHKETVPI